MMLQKQLESGNGWESLILGRKKRHYVHGDRTDLRMITRIRPSVVVIFRVVLVVVGKRPGRYRLQNRETSLITVRRVPQSTVRSEFY